MDDKETFVCLFQEALQIVSRQSIVQQTFAANLTKDAQTGQLKHFWHETSIMGDEKKIISEIHAQQLKESFSVEEIV